MAHISIHVTRDNGVDIQANGKVDDEVIAEVAMTLSAMLFDASLQPAPVEPTPPAV